MTTPRLLAFLPLAALALGTVQAQGLFKIVGPDGRVTFSDRPLPTSEGRAQPVNRDTGRASDPQLPFALRQVATRFPVTLFTAVNCGEPCTMARSYLLRRGVPYAERVANSAEERESWVSVVGGAEMPTLLVGSQSLRGFAPAAWDETLDVAGYPRTSQLPANYQPPPPVPLIPPKAVAQNPAPPALPAAQPTLSDSSPGTIRF
jgi:glutaredoxin